MSFKMTPELAEELMSRSTKTRLYRQTAQYTARESQEDSEEEDWDDMDEESEEDDDVSLEGRGRNIRHGLGQKWSVTGGEFRPSVCCRVVDSAQGGPDGSKEVIFSTFDDDPAVGQHRRRVI